MKLRLQLCNHSPCTEEFLCCTFGTTYLPLYLPPYLSKFLVYILIYSIQLINWHHSVWSSYYMSTQNVQPKLACDIFCARWWVFPDCPPWSLLHNWCFWPLNLCSNPYDYSGYDHILFFTFCCLQFCCLLWPFVYHMTVIYMLPISHLPWSLHLPERVILYLLVNWAGIWGDIQTSLFWSVVDNPCCCIEPQFGRRAPVQETQHSSINTIALDQLHVSCLTIHALYGLGNMYPSNTGNMELLWQ